MALLAFLPGRALAFLCAQLPNEEILSAASWSEVHQLALGPTVTSIIIDPTAEGHRDLKAAQQVITRHSHLPVFAYVPPTPENLRSVFLLSRHGLTDAFCVGDFNPTRSWRTTFTHTKHARLAYSFLSLIEARLGLLPYKVAAAICDSFERPQVYHQVNDLAQKSGIPPITLYRMIRSAGLGSPRKLLAISKALRGIAYMQATHLPITAVAEKLRYSDTRVFYSAIKRIFQTTPASLRRQSSEEVLLHLAEWLYKPAITPRSGQTSSNGNQTASVRTRENSRRRRLA